MYSVQRVFIQIDEEGEVQLGCVLVRFLQWGRYYQSRHYYSVCLLMPMTLHLATRYNVVVCQELVCIDKLHLSALWWANMAYQAWNSQQQVSRSPQTMMANKWRKRVLCKEPEKEVQKVNTNEKCQCVIKWIEQDSQKNGIWGIAGYAGKQFGSIFSGHQCANCEKACDWWYNCANHCNDKCPGLSDGQCHDAGRHGPWLWVFHCLPVCLTQGHC